MKDLKDSVVDDIFGIKKGLDIYEGIRSIHFENYDDELSLIKKESELVNLLSASKVKMEYCPNWGFAVFYMRSMQVDNPKLFRKIYLETVKCFEDIVPVMIDDGRIEFRTKSNRIGRDVSEDVRESMEWCESADLDFEDTLVTNIYKTTIFTSMRLLRGQINFNKKSIKKGFVFGTGKNKEITSVEVERLKSQFSDLHVEMSDTKCLGVWKMLVTSKDYILDNVGMEES